MTTSLAEIELAVKKYNFKGVYIHIYGFDIPLHDRKMYPLYAKCAELDVPVSMQVGHVLESMPSEHGRPMYLDQIASDFPALRILGAHTGWPWVEELISVCYKRDNVWFGVDARPGRGRAADAPARVRRRRGRAGQGRLDPSRRSHSGAFSRGARRLTWRDN